MRKFFLKNKEKIVTGIPNKVGKVSLKAKQYLASKMSSNKYLLQDKHSFKPLLIEIEDRPVSPVGNFILWAIVCIFFIGIVWLSISEIDVVVTARGKIEPSGNIKTVQSTYSGNIKEIFVKGGDSVKKGDILIELDPFILNNEINTKEKFIKELDTKMKRLVSLIENREFKFRDSMTKEDYNQEKDIYLNEKKSYYQQLSLIEEKMSDISQKINIAKLEKRNKISNLSEEKQKKASFERVIDIIPRVQYIQEQYKIESLKNEIKSYDNKLKGLNNNLQELLKQKKMIKFSNNTKYYTELVKISQEKNKLISEVKTLHLQKDKYNILSPVDGYILKLDINTKEGVVTPAQKLITIVPNTVKLMAKVDIENKDIGYIRDNIEALLKIDTFDFQKYGFIHAKLKKISNSSIEREKVGLVYEADLLLESNYLLYNGEKKLLRPGMTVTAELKVGKRRLIEFFIYPAIKYFNEGVSII